MDKKFIPWHVYQNGRLSEVQDDYGRLIVSWDGVDQLPEEEQIRVMTLIAAVPDLLTTCIHLMGVIAHKRQFPHTAAAYLMVDKVVAQALGVDKDDDSVCYEGEITVEDYVNTLITSWARLDAQRAKQIGKTVTRIMIVATGIDQFEYYYTEWINGHKWTDNQKVTFTFCQTVLHEWSSEAELTGENISYWISEAIEGVGVK